MMERGRHMSEASFRTLESLLLQEGEMDKLRKLKQMIKKLQNVLPQVKGHTIADPAHIQTESCRDVLHFFMSSQCTEVISSML
ncbi:hypothetical protein EV1_005809 [Malus domestica]